MLPCVIQGFDHPSALEPVATLSNLNALRLRGRCLGLLLPGPTVSTWEEAQGSGAPPQSPMVDTNCNRPEIEGWAWAWRGPEVSPSRQASESLHPTCRGALETLHSPSSGTSVSTDSPSSECTESPASTSPSTILYPGPMELPISPSLGVSPSSGSTESLTSPSPSPSPSPGSTESSASPSPSPSPSPGPTESLASLSPSPSPSPGPTESPASPSPNPCLSPGPMESPASPSHEPSLSPRSTELLTSPSLEVSMSPRPTEYPTSPSPSPSPYPGPTELPTSPSPSPSPYPRPTELPTCPSLGDSPSPAPTKSPAPPSPRAPTSPGPQEFLTFPAPKTGPAEFPASSSSGPPDCQGSAPSTEISGSLTSSAQCVWGMDGAPTSVGFILSPELLRSRGFSMPGSLVSSLSLPAGACPTSSPSPELSGFLRCSPGPGISEPLRPPSLHPGSLASRPESTSLGAECHPDPRFAGQGSSGTRVTTFHELALRRRRPTVPAPRPPAPLPADSTSGPPPPPPVITFRELRWRGRVNGAGPREEAVEETPLPADWLPAVAGSSAGRGTADGGTKPAREVDRGSPPPRESGRKHPRMGEVTPMASIHPPSLEARGPTLKPPSKRGLVCAVSASVDNLIAHFSAARNVVQKTQLGNSRDSPRVGHMLLAGLCPALSAVLGNGLKVYRHDLVVGRRPNSPWTVVEASVKAGHTPRHLYNVFHQLDGLSQLSGSQRKFNAFVFALLNLKLLDFWMASLHNCTGALRTLYTPSAFLCLSHSELFEELLLLLQPLSTFSFQLDPLFEYHHSPQASEISRLGQMVLGTDQLDRTKWQGDKEPCASRADQAFPGSPAGVEEGYRVQETLDQVSWCAWRLGRAVLELGVGREAQGNPRPSEVGAGWWGQLARSCQVDLLLPNYPSRGLGVGPRQGEVARAQGDATAGAQRDPMAGAQGHPTAGAQRDPTDGAGLMDSTWDIPHGTETPRLILASLFGARIPGTHSPRHPEHQKSPDPRGRLPSDWLRLNISNLWRAPPAKTARPPGTGEVKTQGGETRKSARTVQTLCDHQAVEDGHLDFRRGETLEVLGFFDDAWIRCRRGNASGLVPIEYTSLVWP